MSAVRSLGNQYLAGLIQDDADDDIERVGWRVRVGQDSSPWHCLYFLPEPQGQG